MEFKGEAEGKINGLEETMAAQQNQVKEKLEYYLKCSCFYRQVKVRMEGCVGILTNSFLFVSLYLGQFVCRRNGADCRRSQVLLLPCSTNK